MGSLEINRHPIHPVACLFENHVAKSANKRKIPKVCDRTHQNYRDPDSPNIYIDQTDDGAVLTMGRNFVFFGIGRDGHGCKIYSSWKYYPLPKPGIEVQCLIGSMMGINGMGPHLSYQFFADRTSDPWDDIEMGIVRPPHKMLTVDILEELDFGGPS
jgi:hypothetical protein